MPDDSFDDELVDEKMKADNKVRLEIEYREEVTVMICRWDKPFAKAINAFLNRYGMDPSTSAVEFISGEGNKIQPQDTPKMHEFMPGTTHAVEVMLTKIGG